MPTPISTATQTAAPAPWAPPASTGSFAGGVAIPALLLAGLGAAAFLVTRKRTQRTRLVEVLETQSLGTRRSLVVARLGDELLVLGASEAGIALLTTTPAPLAARAPAQAQAPATEAAPADDRGLLARLRLRPQRSPAPVFDSLLTESMEDLELRRKLAVGQGGSVR
ncbi:MAG: flagellar biosynthetic protein FliO [Deltaproteobacteria bacterium]|nr:flagellar biosynthetic protein FliO [Deltaproteobacteria bacterium]